MNVPAASEESRDKYKDDMLSVRRPFLDACNREAEQYLMEDSEPVPEVHRAAFEDTWEHTGACENIVVPLALGRRVSNIHEKHMSSRPDALLGQGLRML